MKIRCGALQLLGAGMLALIIPSHARAQLETFNTITDYNGSASYGFTGSGTVLSQTFTDIAQLDSLTYQFVEVGTDSVDQTINAYLVQWDPPTNSVDSTITTETTLNDPGSDVTTSLSDSPLATFVVPPLAGDGNGSWTSETAQGGVAYEGFQETLSIDQDLDPGLTYALVLIDTTDATGLGLAATPTEGNSFNGLGTGYASYQTYVDIMAMEECQSNYTIDGAPSETFGFSAIAMVPGDIAPVAEPRTAGAALCMLLVAGLACRQWLARRKLIFAGEPA